MAYTTIPLQPDYTKANLTHVGSDASLKLYLIEENTNIADGDALPNGMTRPMILICPGGGYDHLSPREGEPIARRMNEYGYHAAVLEYSLIPNRFPTQLLEAAMAVKELRAHATEWNINSEQILIMGFSAGAHVAGSLGTKWTDPIITQVLGGSSEDYRPYAQALCYPVISSGKYAHRGSFTAILGEQPTEDALRTVSLEHCVSANTVPTFIWHTFADTSVPVENSFLMATALRAAQVPCELHIYERGAHGLALANAETDTLDGAHHEAECTSWPELFHTWACLRL